MKVNNILTWVDPRTKIRLILNIYDMKFSTEHFAKYYIELGNTNELLVRDVIYEGYWRFIRTGAGKLKHC